MHFGTRLGTEGKAELFQGPLHSVLGSGADSFLLSVVAVGVVDKRGPVERAYDYIVLYGNVTSELGQVKARVTSVGKDVSDVADGELLFRHTRIDVGRKAWWIK